MSPQIVFIAIIGVMFLPTSFAIISTILIVFLSFLLISCLREGNKLFRILSNRKVVFVGLISSHYICGIGEYFLSVDGQ